MMQRVSVSVEDSTFVELQHRAARERRSVSSLAAWLIEHGLGPPTVIESLAEGGVVVVPDEPGPALGEGEPSGDVSMDLAASTSAGPAVTGSSPSPSATGPVSEAFERMGPAKPKPGECERAVFHRVGEFCKACGEMQ